MYVRKFSRRFYAVFFSFLLIFSFFIIRLFYIQFFRSHYLSQLARRQHQQHIELEPRRGTIYDRNLKPQAVNIPMDSLYAVPRQIKDKESLIKQLNSVLGLDYSFLKDRLYRDKSFIWIARKLSPAKVKEIKQLGCKWLGFVKESRRCYPNTYLASHIIGFTGIDNTGLEGVELKYNNYLKGQAGFAWLLRDARGVKLDILENIMPPKDGYNLILTLDEIIQFIAERELERVFKDFQAKQASIVVLNPHTGEILAWASRPNFDLNIAKDADSQTRRNRIITDIFEPGSSFKIITAAAAIEENKVKESDKCFCEEGSYRVGNHILHDHHPHGWLEFREVIEQSSNIGTTKIAQLLGKEIIYRYVKLFGFGSKLGMDLPGEIEGLIRRPHLWSKTSIAAVPIGHEVGVTVLQLTSAISVIANGGLLMRPYVLKEVRDKYNEKIKVFSPSLIRKVLSTDTANRVKDILTGVVQRGTGRLAQIPGYKVAGKTGTAQKIGPDGRYSHRKFVAVFIGFVPADDPAVAICVVVDEPRPYYFGGVVCAPVFKRVAIQVLKYLQIRPQKEEPQGLVVSRYEAE